MKLLLDTHIFLWYITNDQQLSLVASSAIREEGNDVYLSTVSFGKCSSNTASAG